MDSQPSWNLAKLNRLIGGLWPPFTLHAAVRLGLLGRLASAAGPLAARELASQMQCDLRGLTMLLDALAALDLALKQEEGYLIHPQVRRFFLPGGPDDLTNMALHHADLALLWEKLPQAVKSGQPVPRTKVPEGKPDRSHFYRAMRDIARQQARGLAARLGLTPGMHLLDLGGGPGVYAFTFCDETKGLKATVFDLPEAEPYFGEEAQDHAQAAAVEFRAGDYSNPGADLGGPYQAAWLSQILHQEAPKKCALVVELAAAALAPGGRMFIQEFILDNQRTSPLFPALFSLNMLVNTDSGQSYSQGELAGFMTAAGLSQVEPLGPTVEGGAAALICGVKPG